jgi:hypothetical protein
VESTPKGDAAPLEWVYSPWSDRSGPSWRRPQLALLITLLIALLAGFSVTYPNYPEASLSNLREEVASGFDIPSGPTEPMGEVRPLEPQELEQRRKLLEQLEFQRQYWPLQMLAWGFMAALLLVGMTATLYLPVRHRLDDKGVTVWMLGVPNFRAWSHYRNHYFHDNGVYLTSLPQPMPRLDPFRGHFMRYGGNRAEVEAYVREHLKEWKGKPNP